MTLMKSFVGALAALILLLIVRKAWLYFERLAIKHRHRCQLQASRAVGWSQ